MNDDYVTNEDDVTTYLVTDWDGPDYYVAYDGTLSLGEAALRDEVTTHETHEGAITAWHTMMRGRRAGATT